MVSELETLKAEIVTACRILVNEGLVTGWGHFSARLPQGDRFLITPRMSLALVQEGDLVTLNLEAERLEGEPFQRKGHPLESHIHAAIYRHRPDVRAVARTHSPYAKVLSILGKPVQLIDQSSTFLSHEVPVFPKAYLIGSRELGEELARALGQAHAVLLRANGTAVVGRSVVEACVRALMLEESARYQYLALAIGEPIPLTPDELEKVSRVMLGEVELHRGWEYYKSRLPAP